jgi:ATP-dependent Lon protease
VIIPENNKKDLVEIPKTVKSKLKYVFVKHVDEILDAALLKESKKKTQITKAKKKRGSSKVIEAVR